MEFVGCSCILVKNLRRLQYYKNKIGLSNTVLVFSIDTMTHREMHYHPLTRGILYKTRQGPVVLEKTQIVFKFIVFSENPKCYYLALCTVYMYCTSADGSWNKREVFVGECNYVCVVVHCKKGYRFLSP
jgi:hypothetical protein